MAKSLITIGIPTYNRINVLPRAVESALAQDCGNLEVLISDNASTDGTEAYCRSLAAEEPAVRYMRQSVNGGPTANFNVILGHARGDYVLLLSDDDWLSSCYVSRCVEWLRAHPDYAMAAGSPLYHREDGATASGSPTDLPQVDPARRVHAYFRAVADNATFYGVLPRETLLRVSTLANTFGADWLFMAEVAAHGKIAALPDVHLHRSLGGNASGSHGRLAETLGLSAVHTVFPFFFIWRKFLLDVLWRSPVYRQTAVWPKRLILAVLCGIPLSRRQAWLFVLALGRWPPTRPPYRVAKSLYLILDRWTDGRLPPLKFLGYSTAVGPTGRQEHRRG